MLLYLATPYQHNDPTIMQARFEAVNRVAAVLIAKGYHVFSPISHTHPIALAGELPRGWDYWEAYDRLMIAACDKLVVYMRVGWIESKGVAAEIAIAQEYGKPIDYIFDGGELGYE